MTPLADRLGGLDTGRRDLGLFQALNEAYRERPLVPRPRPLGDATYLAEQARKRAVGLETRIPVRGRRVLEIGCGRGHLGRALVDELGCDYTGLDIVEYGEWADLGDDLRLVARDVVSEGVGDLGSFDAIVSFAVMEHVHHPFTMLSRMRELLRPEGRIYLSANLYRGPKASHRYREVFFPWPHLLFTDAVIREFYQAEHGTSSTAAWVNKLTYQHYLFYFAEAGLHPHRTWLDTTPLDEEMYDLFESTLGRYPRYDLQQDFVHAILGRADAPDLALADVSAANARVAELERELAKLKASTSWRVSAPVRVLGGLAKAARRRS